MNNKIYFIKISFKNLLRQKKRTFLLILSLSLAYLGVFWLLSFFQGMNRGVEKSVIEANNGDFQIFPEKTEKFLKFQAKDWVGVKEDFKLNEMTIHGEGLLEGVISHVDGAKSVLLIGINPNDQHVNFPKLGLKNKFEKLQKSGNPESDEIKIIVGKGLVDKYKLELGESLLFNYVNSQEEIVDVNLIVSEKYEGQGEDFEQEKIYLLLQDLNYLKNGRRDLSSMHSYNRLIVRMNSVKKINITPLNIKGEIKTWRELHPELSTIVEFNWGMIQLFMIITFFASFLMIFTPLLFNFLERQNEYHSLLIIGLSRKNFFKWGIYEMVILSFVSWLMGTLIFFLIYHYQQKSGVDFTPLLPKDASQYSRSGVLMPTKIFPHLSFKNFLLGTLVILSSVCSCSVLTLLKVWSKLMKKYSSTKSEVSLGENH